MKTPSKKLVNQLLSHIKNNNTTASKIKNRQSKNIYPLGIRNFYDFCRGKPVSESSILKIEKFFELDLKVAEMVELLQFDRRGAYANGEPEGVVLDFLKLKKG